MTGTARGTAIAELHTILEHGGPVKLDHDLIRIFIFLHITHIAQALGWHQRSVLAVSRRGSGGFRSGGRETVVGRGGGVGDYCIRIAPDEE